MICSAKELLIPDINSGDMSDPYSLPKGPNTISSSAGLPAAYLREKDAVYQLPNNAQVLLQVGWMTDAEVNKRPGFYHHL
ncbi:hypothetical protein AYI68_g2020 [Smittium mucronatum]|uniref:Uncharacterized protein n=1 Tax=Smittium mucronatum TaxID=133383 RepID=A0A1R0H3X7_9FUNG|nr:hypothetical protein AYI68_g2020 [Smittium mucronatum]